MSSLPSNLSSSNASTKKPAKVSRRQLFDSSFGEESHVVWIAAEVGLPLVVLVGNFAVGQFLHPGAIGELGHGATILILAVLAMQTGFRLECLYSLGQLLHIEAGRVKVTGQLCFVGAAVLLAFALVYHVFAVKHATLCLWISENPVAFLMLVTAKTIAVGALLVDVRSRCQSLIKAGI